jgi:hypothetical protein
MDRRWFVLLLLPLPAVLAGCYFPLSEFGDSSRFKEEFHESHPMKAGGQLYLENMNGSVEVQGWDQATADISGTKSASTEQSLSALKIDIVASDDSIRIRTVRPSGHMGGMGARYVIKVPRQTRLEKIATSNGRITITGIEASARLETSNGSVNADGVKGGLEVSTSNGSIRVSLSDIVDRQPVTLRTSNGSVQLSVASPGLGDLAVSTSNGSITAQLPASVAATVDASTSNGSITNEFSDTFRGTSKKNHLEGSIGTGGPRIRLSTSNGSIRLRKL